MTAMSTLRYARLPLPVPLDALHAEVAALPDAWRPHFQVAHHEGGWSVLPLRAPEDAVDEAIPFALAGTPARYRATRWLAQCPAIERFTAGLACPVLAVRLLRLAPGAAIKPHRDAGLAFENGEARLHVPIVSHADVEFVIEGDRVEMLPGTCWYINANLTHHVINRGTCERIHLVLDCTVDDWLRARFAEGERTYTTSRRAPHELRQMIALLREMDAPAARELVAALEAELAGAQ